MLLTDLIPRGGRNTQNLEQSQTLHIFPLHRQTKPLTIHPVPITNRAGEEVEEEVEAEKIKVPMEIDREKVPMEEENQEEALPIQEEVRKEGEAEEQEGEVRMEP